MPSDNPSNSPQVAWEGLEDRIQRLLDIVVKLRSSNGQLMRENQKLKLQTGQKPSLPQDSPDDDVWRLKYMEALEDLQQLRDNLKKMKPLIDDLESTPK